MVRIIRQPTVVSAAGNLPKRIEEYVGRVNTATREISIAKMTSPAGWVEPGQKPEFTEYTVVLRGMLHLTTREGEFEVAAGEAAAVEAGTWVRYSTPHEGGAEYLAVCLPAFAPETVHRDEGPISDAVAPTPTTWSGPSDPLIHDDFHIVTGGPGSGKSSLAAALSARGFATMPEAGRAIIQDQLLIGGQSLPWADREAFAELMLAWEMRSYREAAGTGRPVIFDRGLPDIMGYLRLCGLPVPERVRRACRVMRYHRRVFLAPPWRAIYQEDAERKQSWAEAEATGRAMIDTYRELGYEIVPLPFASVGERVAFVENLV